LAEKWQKRLPIADYTMPSIELNARDHRPVRMLPTHNERSDDAATIWLIALMEFDKA
jgi:hypothetical protein